MSLSRLETSAQLPRATRLLQTLLLPRNKSLHAALPLNNQKAHRKMHGVLECPIHDQFPMVSNTIRCFLSPFLQHHVCVFFFVIHAVPFFVCGLCKRERVTHVQKKKEFRACVCVCACVKKKERERKNKTIIYSFFKTPSKMQTMSAITSKLKATTCNPTGIFLPRLALSQKG